MATIFEENIKWFTIGYVLHVAYDVSFTKLEDIVPASRKTISKEFGSSKSVAKMSEAALGIEPSSVITTKKALGIEEDGLDWAHLCSDVFGHDMDVPDNDPEEEAEEIAEWLQEEAADYSYVATPASIVITKGTETRTVKKSMDNYQTVRAAILNDDLNEAWESASIRESIMKVSAGNIEIEGNTIKFKGLPMKNEMANRIMALIGKDGMKWAGHLAAFADKCMENPSFRAVNELLGFMEKNTLPITADGDFLTYKKVGADYFDIHSKSVLNKPAHLMDESERRSAARIIGGKNNEVVTQVVDGVTVVQMPRNAVDDNYNNTCSNGLHVCGYSYLGHFGSGVILVCKVNPADVVSVPRDYDSQKMRVSRYTVLKEIKPGEQVKSMYVEKW